MRRGGAGPGFGSGGAAAAAAAARVAGWTRSVVGVEAPSGPVAPARPPARGLRGKFRRVPVTGPPRAREPKVFFPSPPTAGAVAPWRPGAPRRTWCAGTRSALGPGGGSPWPAGDPALSR